MSKEIGGYFELEKVANFDKSEYHCSAVAINTGRNAIPFLAMAKNIKLIYLPYYLCDSVERACAASNIYVKKYHIDSNFLPKLKVKLNDEEFLYVVNYFGLINNKSLSALKRKYKNVIVDNVQAFFARPIKNTPTIYSCRKFFGVPDGGYIYSNAKLLLKEDSSKNRFNHLLGRLKTNGERFYNEFKKNEDLLSTLPLLAMSKETHSIMRRVDYKIVMSKRTRNFNYLNNHLNKVNKLKLKKVKGAYCFPLLLKNGTDIRNKLIQNKIYVPILWPNIGNLNSFEQNLISNLLVLPCDQRYSIDDMKRIINILNEN